MKKSLPKLKTKKIFKKHSIHSYQKGVRKISC